MINVSITNTIDDEGTERIVEFEVKGHAINQGTSEVAAICASVSIATLLTANSIKFVGSADLVDIQSTAGYFKITVKTIDRIVDGLLENLKYTLSGLEEQYPQHIQLARDFNKKFNNENALTPDQALEILAAIPLEDPVHPYMSMSKENIAKTQEAFQIVKTALEEFNRIRVIPNDENKEE